MGVLAREMIALYQAHMNGEPIQLPELPIQYADYTLWQRQWLQSGVLDAHIAYWKQQLAGAPVQLTLPTDRPRSAVQTSDGARLSRLLPLELLQQLKALSQREGATLFMAGLSAFNVLLHYYTGQDDLVVGTDVANRNQTETEHLIGFFVNQLVLRTDLSGNPSFLEVVHGVRKVCLDAYAHQDLPFDHLVKALNLERDLSHTPLFQVKFVLQEAPAQEAPVEQGQSKGLQTVLTAKPVEFERTTAKFDLLLNMQERHDGLSLWLDYRTDLFNAETMARFLQQFEHVIRQMVTFPDVRLDSIQFSLTVADREERALQKQELRQLVVEKLEQVRRDRNLKKPHVKQREEIS
jgi:non-ribosomal peptide synthetase component F